MIAPLCCCCKEKQQLFYSLKSYSLSTAFQFFVLGENDVISKTNAFGIDTNYPVFKVFGVVCDINHDIGNEGNAYFSAIVPKQDFSLNSKEYKKDVEYVENEIIAPMTDVSLELLSDETKRKNLDIFFKFLVFEGDTLEHKYSDLKPVSYNEYLKIYNKYSASYLFSECSRILSSRTFFKKYVRGAIEVYDLYPISYSYQNFADGTRFYSYSSDTDTYTQITLEDVRNADI